MDNDIKIKLLDYASKLESLGDKVSAEVPQVIHEYLTWILVKNCVYSSLSLIGFIILMIVAGRLWKYSKETIDYDIKGLAVLAYVSISALSLLPFLVFTDSTMQCLKVIYAPRVVLIEEAARLATQNRNNK